MVGLRAVYPHDPRRPPVLADAADTLYALHDNARAAEVAQQVLDLHPEAAPAQRRIAWTIVAHTAFEAGQYERAERAYRETLALTTKLLDLEPLLGTPVRQLSLGQRMRADLACAY